MPWTFSHPAAVLPLRRWSHRIPFAGLVIGSMSPDFGYYTGHFDLAKHAHSTFGLFAVCLPAGLLVALLLRWVRRPVIELLPQPHRAALLTLPAAPGWPSVREAAALALAVVVGAATHVAWDSFTHSHGWTVEHLPFLQQYLVRIGERSFHVYNSLQHASTLFGAACLAVAYARWLRRTPAAPGFRPDGHDAIRYKVLLACLLVAVAFAVPMAIALTDKMPGAYALSAIAIRSLIYTTSLCAVLIVLAAILWSRRRGESR